MARYGGAAGEPEPYDVRRALALVTEVQEQGKTERGAAVFASQKFACLSCHRVGEQGAKLARTSPRYRPHSCPQEIAEAVLWPKRRVKPEFVASSIATSLGDIHQGYVQSEDATNLVLRVAATGERLTIAKADVAERQEIGTLMPEGLSAAMTADERRDVVRFLLELGRDESSARRTCWRSAHGRQLSLRVCSVGTGRMAFCQAAGQPRSALRLLRQGSRLLSREAPTVAILPAYPGLDGGSYGHWGNQNEDTWRDDRWNATDLGSLLCGIVNTGEKTIARGVCVRLGEQGELAACFNPETLVRGRLAGGLCQVLGRAAWLRRWAVDRWYAR